MIADSGPHPQQGNPTKPTIALSIAIASAAHKPGRAEACKRLFSQILHQPSNDSSNVFVRIEDEPGKPHEWSERQWKLAIGQPTSHAILLNDDMILCDRFIDTVRNILSVMPAHIINLYNTHPMAHEAKKRGLHWLTSVDGLIGNAYVLPIPALKAFLEWRSTQLQPGVIEALSEDQLINLWAMQHGSLIWHSVPALVQHNTTLPSCYGNTQFRHPTIGPQEDMAAIDWQTDAVHVGRTFKGNHSYLLTAIKGDRLPLVKRHYELAAEGPSGF